MVVNHGPCRLPNLVGQRKPTYLKRVHSYPPTSAQQQAVLLPHNSALITCVPGRHQCRHGLTPSCPWYPIGYQRLVRSLRRFSVRSPATRDPSMIHWFSPNRQEASARRDTRTPWPPSGPKRTRREPVLGGCHWVCQKSCPSLEHVRVHS